VFEPYWLTFTVVRRRLGHQLGDRGGLERSDALSTLDVHVRPLQVDQEPVVLALFVVR